MSLTDQNRLAEFILEATYPTKKKSSTLVGLIHVFFGVLYSQFRDIPLLYPISPFNFLFTIIIIVHSKYFAVFD